MLGQHSPASGVCRTVEILLLAAVASYLAGAARYPPPFRDPLQNWLELVPFAF